MFELWRPTFTKDHRVIASAFLERVRLQMTRMMNGRTGGTCSPSEPINIYGEGLQVNPLKTSTINGIVRRRGTARFPMREERATITTIDVTLRLAQLSDIAIIDASGQTADRVCEVDVTAENITGETIYISVTPSATYDTHIQTLSNAVPLITFGSGAYTGSDPEWCELWFDTTRTGNNANGEWALLGHGASP